MAALIAVVLLLAAVLGFTLVTYPGSHGRVICVLAKDQLSFSDPVLTADSELKMLLLHPLLSAQIVGGHGACVGR